MGEKLRVDSQVDKTGYTFSELFDIHKIQKLQDLFSAATGVASIITEPGGVPLSKPSGFCSLCNIIRDTEIGRQNCRISDSLLGMHNKEGPTIRRCLNGGLLIGGASIVAAGRHVANWLVGQVLDEDYDLKDALKYADLIGVKGEVYAQALAGVRRMSKAQFQDICNFLFLNAQLLSDSAGKNLALCREIKERKSSEGEIRKLNSELELRIRKRTAQLEKSNAELEEINATLEEEVVKRKKAEEELHHLNEDLETKIRERTRQLQDLNMILEEEIVEKTRVEDELRKERLRLEKYRVLAEHANDAMLFVDREGRILEANKAATEIYGYSSGEFAGMTIFELRSPENPAGIFRQMERADREGIIFETAHRCKDGTWIDVEVSSHGTFLSDKRVLLSIIRDITVRKKKEDENRYLSYHDALTGLYNRYFSEQEIKRLDREANLPISIILGDVNDLKIINDAFGHDKGDELLRKAAKAIQSACRKEDIVARWGGDEFIILLSEIGKEETEKIVSRIKKDLHTNLRVNAVNVSMSFGWDTKTRKAEDILKVLKNAEDIMYKHKIIENKGKHGNIINTIINTLHEKNPREEAHSKRVSLLCQTIGKAMGLAESEISRLKIAGLLHDIGKIAIEEGILNKPGKLTAQEWEQIKLHPDIGYRILNSSYEMADLADYILAHHERWDGKGYPKGLKGEEIPFISRIISLADSYDAMISRRSYRDALSYEQALLEIERNSGTQFDPQIAKVFIEQGIK